MEFLRDLFTFSWAVINNWAGYTTGGIAVALLWLWSTHKQIAIPRKIGITTAIVFLFFAFFNVWRDQYKRANNFEAIIHMQPAIDVLFDHKPIKGQTIFDLPIAYPAQPSQGPDITRLLKFELRDSGGPTVTPLRLRLYFSEEVIALPFGWQNKDSSDEHDFPFEYDIGGLGPIAHDETMSVPSFHVITNDSSQQLIMAKVKVYDNTRKLAEDTFTLDSKIKIVNH